MCSLKVVILLAYVVQINAKDLTQNHITKDSMNGADKFVNELVDRALQAWPLDHSGLDETTIAKTHLDRGHGSPVRNKHVQFMHFQGAPRPYPKLPVVARYNSAHRAQFPSYTARSPVPRSPFRSPAPIPHSAFFAPSSPIPVPDGASVNVDQPQNDISITTPVSEGNLLRLRQQLADAARKLFFATKAFGQVFMDDKNIQFPIAMIAAAMTGWEADTAHAENLMNNNLR